MLKRPAEEISLLEIYECIEGPLEKTKCLLDKPICGGEECIFGELLNKVDQEASDYLSKRKLSDSPRGLVVKRQ